MIRPSPSRSSVLLAGLLLAGLPGPAARVQAGPTPDSAVTFTDTCHFSVVARRLMFMARRHVAASVEVSGLVGTARFDLDQPLRARMGIRRIDFALRVEDENGVLIDHLADTVSDGMQSLTLPLRFPAAGRYR
ncbi:MAG: hypothetical protein ACE5IK_14115, partial [Acidobacteriota bacterium]